MFRQNVLTESPSKVCKQNVCRHKMSFDINELTVVEMTVVEITCWPKYYRSNNIRIKDEHLL